MKFVNRRSKIFLVTSIGISISTALLVLFLTIDENTVSSLKQIRLEFLFLVLIIQIFNWFLWGLRIKFLCRSVDKETNLSVKDSFTTVISSLFFATITPSSMGGEPIRVYMLSKKGFSIGDSTAVIVGERILDMIFFIFAFVIALFLLKKVVSQDILTIAFIFIGFIIVLASVGLIYGMIKPDSIKRLVNKFVKSEKILNKVNNEIDNFHDALWKLITGNNKINVVYAAFLSFSIKMIDYLLPTIILLGLGIDVSNILLICFAAQAIVYVITAIPITPGSSGITEISMAYIYSIFINPSIVGIFVLIFRSLTYYFTMIIGALSNLKLIRDYTVKEIL